MKKLFILLMALVIFYGCTQTEPITKDNQSKIEIVNETKVTVENNTPIKDNSIVNTTDSDYPPQFPY